MELVVLRRYIAGESSTAEAQRVEVWAARGVDRRRYLDALRRLYAQIPSEEIAETAAAWQAILRKLEPPAQTPTLLRTPWETHAVHVDVRRSRHPRVLSGAFARPPRQWPLALSVVAALVLVAAGIRVSGGGSAPNRAAVAPAMRGVTTTRGQRAEIRLDDGTYVALGVDSRIHFASDFGTRSRDVYLDGTAYFQVAHDSTQPFVVHTANAVAEDIGTTFVVRAYTGDHTTQVVVAEGSVALRPAGTGWTAQAVLTQGQLGLLVAGQSRPTVSHVDPVRYTAWRQGELVFQDTPLADVVAELNRWYDVDVQLGDASLRAVPLSASFGSESFREALATVTTVLALRAVRKEGVVTLYRRS